jgi:uncharacterized damage-inducible protein DinB
MVFQPPCQPGTAFTVRQKRHALVGLRFLKLRVYALFFLPHAAAMLPLAPTPDGLRRLARYDAWANRRLAAVLRDDHERPLRLLAHAAESELVWLRRIDGSQPANRTADFWPTVDAAGCRALLERAAGVLGVFVADLTENGLRAEAVYRNSKGVEHRTPVADVLTHVLLHSHYHRGQAAAALRTLGVDPLWTDFIAFARQET